MEKLPEMQSVTSHMIAKIGYHAKTQTLYVEFPNGALYSYEEVPQNVFDELNSAESIGSYFIKKIKNMPYVYHSLRAGKKRK